jgi:HEAT repeat protein
VLAIAVGILRAAAAAAAQSPVPSPAPPPVTPAPTSRNADAEFRKWVAFLDSKDELIRSVAINELVRRNGDGAVPPLVQRLAVEPEPRIREKLVDKLGDARSPAASGAVLTASRDPSPDVRIAALKAIVTGKNAQSAAVSANYLVPALNDVPKVSDAALDLAGKVKDARVAAALVARLEVASPDAREKIVAALGAIGAREAIEPLARLLDVDDARLRTLATGALDQIEAGLGTKRLKELDQAKAEKAVALAQERLREQRERERLAAAAAAPQSPAPPSSTPPDSSRAADAPGLINQYPGWSFFFFLCLGLGAAFGTSTPTQRIYQYDANTHQPISYADVPTGEPTPPPLMAMNPSAGWFALLGSIALWLVLWLKGC